MLGLVAGCLTSAAGAVAPALAQPGDPQPHPQKPDPVPPPKPGTDPTGPLEAVAPPVPPPPRPGPVAPPEGVPGAEPESPLAVFESRPVREVRLEGLKGVNEQLVRNQVRTRAGQPMSAEMVRKDVQRLNRLGRFAEINARVEPFDDGTVTVIYQFVETPVITDVQAVGNRQIPDAEIAAVISVLAGTPVDEYALGRAARQIQDLYRRKGYYLAEVEIDRAELAESGIVLFRIKERERVKVADIRITGNEALAEAQLRPGLKTKEAWLFEKGPLDNDVLDADVAAIIAAYRDRGYLDVRADREVRISPNSREAIVTFLVAEGPQYTLRDVRVEYVDRDAPRVPPEPDTAAVARELARERAAQGRADEPVSDEEITRRLEEMRAERERALGLTRAREATRVFTPRQLAGLMVLKPGDAYSIRDLNRSLEAINRAYGTMGYIDARVDKAELRDEDEPRVDLVLQVHEGRRSYTGLVKIAGDDLTRQKVIRRQVQVRPQRPLDGPALEETRRRLNALRLFKGAGDEDLAESVKTTVQEPDPARPGERDVLVNVTETNTGSLTFGVAASSDAGLIGQIGLHQTNFDILDTPDSFEELIRGRAFRGAGQIFDLSLAPGLESQTYSVSLTEPHLFDSAYSGSGALFYRSQEFRRYDEERVGTQLSLGRRFGERWNGAVSTRFYTVDLYDIDEFAPVDVFEVEDKNLLTGLGLSLTRTTTDSRFRPTRGTRLELAAEQVGALGGDFTFTRLSANHTLFVPVYEDFLGRTTVLSLHTNVGYIPQSESDVPVFERFYLGGRSFRGFRFREVSPKGIRNDTRELGGDPVGGTFAFFLGPEIEQPLLDKYISGVLFLDTGTVINDPGFDDYRVSVGVGVRLYIPQLSPVPLAFDFAVPLVRMEGDDTRLFSFSLDVPY